MVRSPPLPLPENPFPQTSTPHHKAYQLCLDLENKALSTSLSSGSSDSAGKLTPLISARLLGHLLRLVPREHERGRTQLGKEIIAVGVDGDDGFIELAEYYVKNLIQVCEFRREV